MAILTLDGGNIIGLVSSVIFLLVNIYVTVQVLRALRKECVQYCSVGLFPGRQVVMFLMVIGVVVNLAFLLVLFGVISIK